MTRDFCCGTCCATKVARVSYLVCRPSCGVLEQVAQQKSELGPALFLRTLLRKRRTLIRQFLFTFGCSRRKSVYVIWSSALCVNRNCCYFLQLADVLNLIYSLLNCFIDWYGVDGIKNWVREVGCAAVVSIMSRTLFDPLTCPYFFYKFWSFSFMYVCNYAHQ